jgi:hypothetical protein
MVSFRARLKSVNIEHNGGLGAGRRIKRLRFRGLRIKVDLVEQRKANRPLLQNSRFVIRCRDQTASPTVAKDVGSR